jgi:hypothetical protein
MSRKRVKISRACNTRTSFFLIFTFGVAHSGYSISSVLPVQPAILFHRITVARPG